MNIIMYGYFEYQGRVFKGAVLGDIVYPDVEWNIFFSNVFFCANNSFQIRDLKILPPVSPSKIICVGLNYKKHADELSMDCFSEPSLFLKPPSSVIGPGESIIYPPQSIQVEHEAELAVVIRKKMKNIRAEEIESDSSFIAGYTCFNDITARDLQKKDSQWTRSKSFDTFAPIGPFVVEPKDLQIKNISPGNLSIRCFVNHSIRQDSNTSDFIFNIPFLIEYISGIMTLNPGDVIATGTPPGVSEIRPGDEVCVAIEGIGLLQNRVVRKNKTGSIEKNIKTYLKGDNYDF